MNDAPACMRLLTFMPHVNRLCSAVLAVVTP